MDDSKKIKLNIYIGDVPLTISTLPEDTDNVRLLESELTSLYKKWRHSFSDKTDKELLAMIAYQYASYYQALTERYKEAARRAHDCDLALDDLEKDLRD